MLQLCHNIFVVEHCRFQVRTAIVDDVQAPCYSDTIFQSQLYCSSWSHTRCKHVVGFHFHIAAHPREHVIAIGSFDAGHPRFHTLIRRDRDKLFQHGGEINHGQTFPQQTPQDIMVLTRQVAPPAPDHHRHQSVHRHPL